MTLSLATSWVQTDRPGEMLSTGTISEGFRFVCVRNSNRHCMEYHQHYSVCLVHEAVKPIGAVYRSRNATHRVGAGDVMLFEPGEHHVTTSVVGRPDYFVVEISPSQMARAAAELGMRHTLRFSASSNEHPAVRRALRSLAQAAMMLNHRLEVDARCVDLLEQLFVHCGEDAARFRVDPVQHAGVRRMRELLRSKFVEPPTLDELAVESGLSRFRVDHAFKSYMGLSPLAYSRLVRDREARRLVESGVPLCDVAALLGYKNVQFLSRCLKRYLGVAPGRWRRVATELSTNSWTSAAVD